MTTKEKAEEITNKHLNDWVAEFVENNNLSKDDRNQIRFKLYNACTEMAEWERKRLVDKACKWLKENIDDYFTTGEFEEWFDDMYEDLRQAMEGGAE